MGGRPASLHITQSSRWSSIGSPCRFSHKLYNHFDVSGAVSAGSTPHTSHAKPFMRRVTSSPALPQDVSVERPISEPGIIESDEGRVRNPYINRFLERKPCGGFFCGSTIGAPKVNHGVFT